MDRMVIAGGYGICLFSADTLQDFLKREKIRKRKLLSLLQKDKELYLNTQREGIFIPLVGIDHYNYAIKLEGQDEPFDDQWVQKISYEGFNLEVKDGLWISLLNSLNLLSQRNTISRKKNFIPHRGTSVLWSTTTPRGNGGISQKHQMVSVQFIRISSIMFLLENICCPSKATPERNNRNFLPLTVVFSFPLQK